MVLHAYLGGHFGPYLVVPDPLKPTHERAASSHAEARTPRHIPIWDLTGTFERVRRFWRKSRTLPSAQDLGIPDEHLLVRRDEELHQSELDGDIMALSVTKGTIYGFNGTASSVWRQLEKPLTLGQLKEKLLGIHLVDEVTLNNDLQRLLRELADSGLISVTPNSHVTDAKPRSSI